MLHHARDCIRAGCFLRLRRTLLPGRPREPRTPPPGRDRSGHGGRLRRAGTSLDLRSRGDRRRCGRDRRQRRAPERAHPRLEHYMGQASLAGALLVALVVGLVLGWRWFERNRTSLVTRTEHLRMFAAARFARGEYLGLHLTIGLAISLAGLWLFAGVTEDVIHHDPLTQFDVALLDWLHARATPTGYAVFNTISSLGSAGTLTILAPAGGCGLTARPEGVLLAGWLPAFAGGGLLRVVR